MKFAIASKWYFFAFILVFLNCGKPFTVVVPEGFATYKGGISFKAVSSDHVVYRVRACKNKPYADFDFWREALPERMKNAGYRIIKDSLLSTDKNKSLLLELAAPIGDADYSYLVMIAVKNKKILIAEAAGVYDYLQNHKKSIITALGKAVLSPF